MKAVKYGLLFTLIAGLGTAQAGPKIDSNCGKIAPLTREPTKVENSAKAIPVVFGQTQTPAKKSTDSKTTR